MIARLICLVFGHDWYVDVCGRCYAKANHNTGREPTDG